jgi:hypothetical protein
MKKSERVKMRRLPLWKREFGATKREIVNGNGASTPLLDSPPHRLTRSIKEDCERTVTTMKLKIDGIRQF